MDVYPFAIIASNKDTSADKQAGSTMNKLEDLTTLFFVLLMNN